HDENIKQLMKEISTATTKARIEEIFEIIKEIDNEKLEDISGVSYASRDQGIVARSKRYIQKNTNKRKKNSTKLISGKRQRTKSNIESNKIEQTNTDLNEIEEN
ncbi:40411_t:CDS:2, partial [Gigaspora margarita]